MMLFCTHSDTKSFSLCNVVPCAKEGTETALVAVISLQTVRNARSTKAISEEGEDYKKMVAFC